MVAAVIRRDGRYLLGRRPLSKRHGGLWEFPGGKVLPGESRLDAARRELAEELGLEALCLGQLLHSASDPGSPFLIEFVEVEAAGEPSPHEHSEVGWYAAEELRELPLAPADALFADRLASGRSGS